MDELKRIVAIVCVLLFVTFIIWLGAYIAEHKDHLWGQRGKARADARKGLFTVEIRHEQPDCWSAHVVGDAWTPIRSTPGAAVEAAMKDFEAREGRDL